MGIRESANQSAVDRGRNPRRAVFYARTSSAANVGDDKDSLQRQRAAVETYAGKYGIMIVDEFYDAGVRGADAVDQRPGFSRLLHRLESSDVGLVLVEDPSRFARDLVVQLTGHAHLRKLGVELIPVSTPEHFQEDTPTARLVRQLLGGVAEFEKRQLVAKLRAARARKRAQTGRCEGRLPVPDEVVRQARRLRRKNPKTGHRRSLRAVAAGLAALGHVGPSGQSYGAESVKRMLAAAG